MKVVMLVENNEKENQQIKQWIETAIADVKVLSFHRPGDAEKKLQEYKTTGVVGCIVLDMFFPSAFTNQQEPLGQNILERYGDIPIVLISKRPETTDYEQTQEHVPLLRLQKPLNFFPAGNPQVKLTVEAFREDLLEAVNCGLLVGSLKGKVARLSKKRTWQPLFETRTGIAAAIFLACVVVYATSILYLAEFLQHLFLAICAVTGVHLLDRAVLFKDFRDAFESVRQQIAELSVEVRRIEQSDGNRIKRADADELSPTL